MAVTLSQQGHLYKVDFHGPEDRDEFYHWYKSMFRAALDWLIGAGLEDHFVNDYLNYHSTTWRVVLNDRDTAIMLKLAVS